MRWQEGCPKCGQMKVYFEQNTNGEKYRILCTHCGYSTRWHDSHDNARYEWDRMVEKERTRNPNENS